VRWAARARAVAAETRRGARARGIGLGPAPPGGQRLGPPQRHPDLAIARGGAGLPTQCRKLLGKLFEHILDAGEVALGGRQAQFGLVPALIEARDPGGIFEHAAPVAGAGVDEFADLPLPDEGGRLRPRRGIGKKDLHVAGAQLAAVQAKCRTGLAGDAARDLDLVGIVETLRCEALGIVDEESHLGEMARGAAGRAREDHILHPLAAHGGRARLAHDPAHRLEQVRLAAAVRADDARQPVADGQIGRVDETLEPVQPQPK
jgi:hypothetical protein